MSFLIRGGKPLKGTIKIQSSKNASLPIISATILTDEKVTLKNIPEITDVHNMLEILKKLGVQIVKRGKTVKLLSKNASGKQIDCELSKTMRSSLFLLGSTLSKFKSMMITLPGGCDIGKRPIDIHIEAFRRLNVDVFSAGECICFDAKNAKPGKIKLKLPSVGATENIVQFACLLKGKTTILNAAREPEVVDLIKFLNSMGAKIYGAGTRKITIYGVNKLHGCTYTPSGDRIVAGTIMVAVAMCGGKVALKNAAPHTNKKLIEILSKLGCQIKTKNDIIKMSKTISLSPIKKISTGYYPDFPTDLQSFMLALSTVTSGKTTIYENIFENRFLTVSELIKMGADIKMVDNNTVIVNGVKNLTGAEVYAKDLRGGASLVLAGLMATGQTKVNNTHFIDRGYEHFEIVLKKLGADIKRI